jgi:hypothetical protein
MSVRGVPSTVHTFSSFNQWLAQAYQQKRGFRVGIAFEFDEYVLAFLTLDFLIQVCVSIKFWSVMHSTDVYLFVSQFGRFHSKGFPHVHPMSAPSGSSSCKELQTGSVARQIRRGPVWLARPFVMQELSGVVSAYIRLQSSFSMVVCFILWCYRNLLCCTIHLLSQASHLSSQRQRFLIALLEQRDSVLRFIPLQSGP